LYKLIYVIGVFSMRASGTARPVAPRRVAQFSGPNGEHVSVILAIKDFVPGQPVKLTYKVDPVQRGRKPKAFSVKENPISTGIDKKKLGLY
jgi:hypothetical protein